MKDYKNIFELAERTLKERSWLTDTEFDQQYGRFKDFGKKKNADNVIFQMLTMIIFYSGFRSSTVEKKEKTILLYFSNYKQVARYNNKDLKRILTDREMIKNEKKIKGCISNAKTFKNIIEEHGNFQNYIDSFNPNESFENLLLLKEELEYQFKYLGGTTVYHFLSDLGFHVLKPDRVLLRIFKRLGLIESKKQLLKAVIQGRQFAIATNQPIRYIDIILVKYGQQGLSESFGLENGICLENKPQCMYCGITEYCKFYKESNGE